MRQRTVFGFLIAVALAAAISLGLPQPGTGRQATPVAGEATPVGGTATPIADATPQHGAGVGFLALGVVEVAGAENPPQVVVLARVTLPPAGEVVDDPHFGTSLLHVESGTVCFRNTDERPGATMTAHAATVPATATATATGTGTVPATGEGCAAPEPACATETGCLLEEGDEILLAAGDSVAQTQTRSYAYRNVGASEAVLIVSELRDKAGSPCGGAC